jgi:ABC-type phosphate/phosphonate transport system substrate-binding protein
MIEQLKGKQLWTTLANSPEYLGRVVLNSQTELAGSLTLKKINQVLKGIRAVLRGEAAATLLDDEQLELARKMEGGDKLRAIYTSPHLPCLPVAVATAQITAKEQAALVKALLGMCSTEKGQETCKLMHIEKFVPVQSDIYQETQKRFEKP